MQPKILTLLSFLPIFSLIIISLIKNIRFSAYVTFFITSLLFYLWKNPLNYYLGSIIASLVATLNVLMIVFGAIYLFEVMKDAKYIDGIKNSLKEIHPSPTVQFFLIAIGLTSFIEGVAGFGTPGAIIPPLLISLGFNPFFSVATVLLADGLFSAFGAVGTPITIGLKPILNLSNSDTLLIAEYSAYLLSFCSIIFFFFIFRTYRKLYGIIEARLEIGVIYISAFFIYCIIAVFIPDFAAIIPPIILFTLTIIAFTKNKAAVSIKPWVPYMILIILLLLPKIIIPFHDFLNYELKITNIFNSGIKASYKPLYSPFFPFVITSIGIVLINKKGKEAAGIAFSKLTSVFLILLPIIAISQLMINSGFAYFSMISFIAQSFSKAGEFYIILAPFIGILGSFITGSTTLSNLLFGISQSETAGLLHLNSHIVIALQVSGASLGNSICLFNIVAACVIAEIKEINQILKKTIIPVLLAGFLIGIMCWLIS